MALQFALLSKQNAEADLETKRAALKALPEEERAGSAELAAFEVSEKRMSFGLYNRFGSDVAEAYLKIQNVSTSSSGFSGNADIYFDSAARNAEAQSMITVNFEFDYVEDISPATNPLQYCYNQIKAMALFSGAVDV